MRSLAVFPLLAGCAQLFGLEEIPPGPSGAISRAITIVPGTTTELVDFPVSIVVDDMDVRANALPDGSDIHFTDPQGAPLPHELVAYADGSLEAWVRVTLAGPTEIRLVYGGEARTSVPSLAWSDLYEAAWHEAEESGTAFDSTSSDHDLAPVASTPDPASTTGRVGRARAFVDSDNETMRERLCAPMFDVVSLGMSSFSFSAWVKAGVRVGTFDEPFEAGGYTNGTGGFGFEISGTWVAMVSDDANGHVEIDFQTNPIGIWTHFVTVVDRGNGHLRNYVNGNLSNNVDIATATPAIPAPIAGAVANEDLLCLGGHLGYSGIVDEVRIYRQGLSPEWIDAEYDNIANREQFVMLAAPP